MCTICLSNFLTSIYHVLIDATSRDKDSIWMDLFSDHNTNDEAGESWLLCCHSNDQDIKSNQTFRLVTAVKLTKQPVILLNDQDFKQSDISIDTKVPIDTPTKHTKNEVQYLNLHEDSALSSAESEEIKLGRMTLRLTYDIKKCVLVVLLVEATKLPRMSKTANSEVFAKLVLYPRQFEEQKTRVIPRTHNTKFNETKVFKPVTESDLSTMTLNVKVYDWNRVMNNRLIGEVNCSLGIILDNDDGTNSNGKRSVLVHKNIIVPTNSEDYLGSVLMSLNLDLQSQQMKITIIKAKDLKAMDANNFSDPYCTIKLFSDDEKIGSRKTSIKYKTLNPIWNESFPFLVTPKAFQKHLKLQIRVYDKDITGKDFIGEIEFPSTPGSIEWKHWGNMVDNPAVTTAEWHSLKAKTKNS